MLITSPEFTSNLTGKTYYTNRLTLWTVLLKMSITS
jgi:hypothetical protein